MNTSVEIKTLPKMQLAYVPHQGDFSKIGDAYGKLMSWAGMNRVFRGAETKTVTIYHDDPNEVGMENVRQSACVTLKNRIEPGDGIGLREIRSGNYAVGRFEINFTEFGASWQSVFDGLKAQGYEHTGDDCFEVYHNNFKEHPENKCIVDICIPVK